MVDALESEKVVRTAAQQNHAGGQKEQKIDDKLS